MPPIRYTAVVGTEERGSEPELGFLGLGSGASVLLVGLGPPYLARPLPCDSPYVHPRAKVGVLEPKIGDLPLQGPAAAPAAAEETQPEHHQEDGKSSEDGRSQHHFGQREFE